MNIHHRPRRRRGLALPVLAVLVTGSLALTACGDSGSGSGSETGECDPSDVTLIGQVRNQTNPYEASWLTGGDTFAESVGLSQQHLTYDGESAKQQDQIRQVLASGDANCTVLNVLPNGDSDTTPIVRQAEAAGAYLVTQWNKPADLQPSDHDRWIAHITYDGQEAGRMIAEALFEAMGGSGGIIALQGILDTSAAQDRFAGLQEALAANPDITLLDEQTANFGRAEGLDITRTLLTRHGDDVQGIWAANDDMALGALQAVEAAGRVGEIAVVGIDAVPEAITAIGNGELTATVSSDGPWQGGIGLAMGYCAAIGELDLDTVPDEQRSFYAEQFLITAGNASQYANPSVDTSEFDCANVFSRVARPLP